MEPNKILNANLLDIIFDGRNKAYGAYELRNTYPARVKKAMIITGAVSLLFITGVLLANANSTGNETMYVGNEVTLSAVPDEPKQQPVIEQPKIKPIKTLAVTPPLIILDKLLDKTDVPTEDEKENALISNITQDGVDPEGTVAPPIEKEGTGKIDAPIAKTKPDDYIPVQIEAQFPGGIKEWTRFLERTLNTEIPTENGAPGGRYTVMVSFIVDKEGNVSDIKALNDPGYGTVNEAIKVIKKSKQWIPAIQNGQNVIYRQQQSITFVVNEG